MKTCYLLLLVSAWLYAKEAVIIDHTCTKFDKIPSARIDDALVKLNIVYTHTSHGSQLTTGMMGLADFKHDPRLTFENGGNGHLDLDDCGCSQYGADDLGNPDRVAWESATRQYLADNPSTNVVVWSWCGEVDYASPEDIDTYLSLMAGLERDFPLIQFVYMTGHVIEGARGNNHERNEQIRSYCRDNAKILYDFADIECYDPDGHYFGDKWCTDGCQYDADGDGDPWNDGGNWAAEWQNTHVEGVDWYSCESAHSEPLNANQKAYAAWWLWARLAGWDGVVFPTNEPPSTEAPDGFSLAQNYPNPFNSGTRIEFVLPHASHVDLSVYDLNGRQVKTLLNEARSAGTHQINVTTADLMSGVYVYCLRSESVAMTKKMLLIK
jgi:hypothetical protein